MDLIKAKKQFNIHKSNSSGRKIPFLLSFDEWCKIWNDSGHYAERGFSKGKYVMSRFNDEGPYSKDNVEIKTSDENRREAALRGNSGQFGQHPFSPETLEKQRLWRVNNERPKLTCPHCGYVGIVGLIKIRHFDKCKNK